VNYIKYALSITDKVACKMENIEDATNLTGISQLLNKQHINDKIDLAALERDMIGGNGIRRMKVNDPAKEFRSRMEEINRDSGMEVIEITRAPDPSARKPSRIAVKNKPSSPSASSSGESGSESGSESESESGSGSESSSGSGSGFESGSDSGSGSGSGESDDILSAIKGGKSKPREQLRPVTSSLRPIDNRPHHSHQSHHSHRPPQAYPPPQPQPQGYPPPQQGYPQQGQQMPPPQAYPPPQNTPLDQAMQAYAGNTIDYGLESREDEEEKKADLLEDIDELKYELEDDDVDLSRIPEVNQDSTIEEIHNVRKTLRKKYDRRRFNSFGTEFILAFAQGVEYICDGERKVGNYTVPDLTNWHNTVRTKLRKLRYETSTIVSGTMEKFNIGPVGRLGLELVPSAFLHSKMRKDQKGKSNYTTDQMSEAYDQLAQYDEN
jgi:hypothetical protein